jgi:ribonuclease HI
MTNIVTVNTDASFNAEYKVGGFAFWVVYQNVRSIQHGPLKDPKDSNDCELKAIANALYTVIKNDYKGVKYIIINTDCMAVIQAMEKGNKLVNGHSAHVIRQIKNYVKELRSKYEIKKQPKFVDWRHVKGHTKGETARAWVNNYLDKASRKCMRKQLPKKSPA